MSQPLVTQLKKLCVYAHTAWTRQRSSRGTALAGLMAPRMPLQHCAVM
jgi:hypothetical protein